MSSSTLSRESFDKWFSSIPDSHDIDISSSHDCLFARYIKAIDLGFSHIAISFYTRENQERVYLTSDLIGLHRHFLENLNDQIVSVKNLREFIINYDLARAKP